MRVTSGWVSRCGELSVVKFSAKSFLRSSKLKGRYLFIHRKTDKGFSFLHYNDSYPVNLFVVVEHCYESDCIISILSFENYAHTDSTNICKSEKSISL